jgi:hypothetical protein
MKLRRYAMSIQRPLFLEDGCKYIVEHRGKVGDVWRMNNKWYTQNYAVLPDSKVRVLERIGTPKEIFN